MKSINDMKAAYKYIINSYNHGNEREPIKKELVRPNCIVSKAFISKWSRYSGPETFFGSSGVIPSPVDVGEMLVFDLRVGFAEDLELLN